MSQDAVTMDKIVSLSKRRGFVFPSSEIYGGLGSSYDYGHYGVLLKDNVKARWLEAMVRERNDIVALDSSIILHPRVWEVSGHVGGFSDPLIDCRFCKKRFRADHLDQEQCGKRPSKKPGETPDCDLTEPRQFNLMFQTRVGAMEESGVDVYLRPETAQGIFINFKNVAQLARRKPPFGIAQIGKSFRNEITPGNFIFRTLEFEQMEMEFFVPPDEAAEWYRYWVDERLAWHVRYGVRESHLRVRPHEADELSHYSSETSDIEYLFPIGWSELEGIANRGDFDLTQHTEASGTKLEWFEESTGERYVPHVIEPALGVNRSLLTFLIDAYDEEVVGERERTVLRLHPQLAPVKAAILPLVGKDTAMVEKARALHEELRRHFSAEYDDNGAIGRRYRRQDEIGTPYGLTIDEQTLDGRHGHGPRPRLAGTGADSDRRRAAESRRAARGRLALPEDRLARRPLEQTLARREAQLLVQPVRIRGVQDPAACCIRAFVDGEPHELDAPAVPAMLGQHEDVSEVDEERVGSVHGARIAGQPPVGRVQADVARGPVDQPVHHVPGATEGPVRLLGDEPVDGVPVDASGVVVELVALPKLLLHAESVRSRKPPWCSYDARTIASASRAPLAVSPASLASARGVATSVWIARTPADVSAIDPGPQSRHTAPPAAGR